MTSEETAGTKDLWRNLADRHVSAPEGYRYDIQGLRAIAVLLVLLFHIDIPVLPGGFVGVDIFFVISGFVIFKGLSRDHGENNVSITRFYKRRLFRLLPALGVTITATLLYGCLILTPDELISLSESGLAALVAVSNLYFHDRSDYFADAAYNLPLLHTWSLGVEEQFYVLAPALFILVTRTMGVLAFGWILMGICLFSFAYNLYFIFVHGAETSAFYMPMSRFWEIGVGGVIALLLSNWRPSPTLSIIFALSGLAAIALGAILIDDGTLFPGFAALMPVGGTALIILARLPDQSLIFRGLTAAPLQFLGKISYSTYLVHWPVVVFYKMHVGRALTLPEMTGLFIGVIVLAFLSWRFVEVPFQQKRDDRHRPSPRKRGWVLTTSWAGIAASAAFLISSGGLPERLSPEAARVAESIAASKRDYRTCAPIDQFGDHAESICSFSGVEGGIDYVLWGDSHAKMLSQPISDALAARGLNGVVSVLANCPSLAGIFTKKRENREQCLELAKRLVDLVDQLDIPVVILANRWANLASPVRAPGDGTRPWALFDAEDSGRPIDFTHALHRTVEGLRKAGARVVIIGPIPESYFDVPDMLVRTLYRDVAMPVLARGDFDLRQTLVLETLRAFERQPDVSIVYPHQSLCNVNECRLVDGSRPLYSDDDHLSLSGVSRVLPLIISEIVRPTNARRRR